MLLAIALQESKAAHRVQIGGPAHGFYQFEKGTPQTKGGVTGLVVHPKTAPHLAKACATLRYPFSATAIYEAITHNDVLSTLCARLLLWTLPVSLPGPGSAQEGWRQYLSAWRPGKPHPGTWDAHYTAAWQRVI